MRYSPRSNRDVHLDPRQSLPSLWRSNLGLLGDLLSRLRSRRSSAFLSVGTRSHVLPAPSHRVMVLLGLAFGARRRVKFFLVVQLLALLLLAFIQRLPVTTLFYAGLSLLVLLQSLFAVGYRIHLSENLQDKKSSKSQSRSSTVRTYMQDSRNKEHTLSG